MQDFFFGMNYLHSDHFVHTFREFNYEIFLRLMIEVGMGLFVGFGELCTFCVCISVFMNSVALQAVWELKVFRIGNK